MASLLTNTSAMVALQTLKQTNRNLEDVQAQISTGKAVASAKDNAAVFAISQVMQSDVTGFKAISESLSLGSSTVAVASNASSQINGLLNEIKGKIVAANESNVDRNTLQNEIGELRDQITGIVDAAQFNGLNLLKSEETVEVLASLDRAASGQVTTSKISVDGRNFTTEAGSFGTGGSLTRTSLDSATAGVVTPTAAKLAFANSATFFDAAGDVLSVVVGDNVVTVTQPGLGGNAADEAVAAAVKTAIDNLGIAGLTVTQVDNAGAAELDFSYAGGESIEVSIGGAALGTTGITAPTVTGDDVTAGVATLAGASGLTTTASTTSVTFTGTAAAVATTEDIVLTVGTESVTFSPGSAVSTNAGLETEIVAAYAALVAAGDGIDGITVAANTATGVDGIVISNARGEELSFSLDLSGATTQPGSAISSSSTLAAATENAIDVTIGAGAVNEGDSFRVSIDGTNYDYVAGKNQTINDVAAGLQSVIRADGPSDVNVAVTLSNNVLTTAATLSISSDQGRSISALDAGNGTATGDLYGLSRIDVTTDEGAAAALNNIESLIQTVIGAQADFGASERRIELQNDFMDSLIDSFKAGIGTLIDADLEEASARLQALQVQQQLGIQALSIANQAPQSILALFR